SGEGIEGTADQITVARTMLRQDEEAYKEESKPELHGILVTKHVESIYEKFWEHQGKKIHFEQEMLAGLVASLESIGEEMFSETESIGGLEIGGADVLVQHRGDYNFSFFVKNVDPNTSVIIDKEISNCSTDLSETLEQFKDHPLLNSKLDPIAEAIFLKFKELFG
ncbi:MAG: hypothetical protein ACXAD7_23170, partial [Candidatus Kariarchaeaceae archaeon]